MDILKRDDGAFVGGDIDASDTGHGHDSCCRERKISPANPVPVTAPRSANDNTTPSPSPGARHRSNFPLDTALLKDSEAFRQPLRAEPFARGARPAGARAVLALRAALAGFLAAFLAVALAFSALWCWPAGGL